MSEHRVTKPEEMFRFVELKPFTTAWADLGLGEEDLTALQIAIMMGPQDHPVVQGTGGLRKMRFAPRKWKKGKSGAARVGYVYLENHGTVLLVIAYAKDEQDDLTAEERKIIRSLIQRIEHEFSSGIIR